jgi:hypothetical protein
VQGTVTENVPSEEALFAWLLSQQISPGDGTWVSHLCSPNEGFLIPESMGGKGVQDRMRRWLSTLDGVEVYQDNTLQREWSFRARPSNYSFQLRKRGVETPLAKEAEAEVAARLLEPPIPTKVAEEDPWLRQMEDSAHRRDQASGIPSPYFDRRDVEAALSEALLATPVNGDVEAAMLEAGRRYRTVLDEFQRHAVTEYRTTSAVRPIKTRIREGDLPLLPNSYLPHIGDDYGLLFRFLLKNMPLDRVGLVWSVKQEKYASPGNMGPLRFHHDYMKAWHADLGDSPSLYELRSYAHSFLTKKCAPCKVEEAIANPEKAFNEFKWKGFYMDSAEIDAAVKRTIYQYGFARLGEAWVE